jgi:hypothetical protein
VKYFTEQPKRANTLNRLVWIGLTLPAVWIGLFIPILLMGRRFVGEEGETLTTLDWIRQLVGPLLGLAGSILCWFWPRLGAVVLLPVAVLMFPIGSWIYLLPGLFLLLGHHFRRRTGVKEPDQASGIENH